MGKEKKLLSKEEQIEMIKNAAISKIKALHKEQLALVRRALNEAEQDSLKVIKGELKKTKKLS
jgi:hypothetical protein